MKKLFTKAVLCLGLFASVTANADNLWQQVDAGQAPKSLQVMHPASFLVYTMDEATLKFQMWNLSTDPDEGMIITLPMPDGTARDFRVWQTPIMPAELADKYPDIKTFTAEAINDRSVTAKIDFTVYGFHAMIYNSGKTSFIDPYDHLHDGFYMVHYKKDETRTASDRMKCVLHSKNDAGPIGESMELAEKPLPKLEAKTTNGYQLRTYRLALSADNFYCQAATGLSTPTIAQALSCMTTSLNRINGVYEREFSIKMVFVAKEDTLIWTQATGTVNGSDPFNSIDANANACLNTNQTECDGRIGSGNYDIGHVFTTGGGGLSLLGCVCQDGSKAQSVTGSPTPVGDGYDIDYVAHEMGHEYGSDHTFNNNTDGSCGGNAVNNFAYEPGSGSTIMAYAGICGPDDLQFHSDPYFHASSIEQILGYITAGGGDVCAVKTATSNKLVAVGAFTATHSIPFLTPFELTAPVATDSVSDSVILYAWDEWDLGDFGAELVNTHLSGPIFRSYDPTPSVTRVFPQVSMVLAGVLSNAGTEGAEGEKVPDVARTMTFKCTFRDIIHNLGCVTYPDDIVTLNAINTTTGFKVTSQATAVSYAGGSTQTVTWNVVGSNAAPISATNVDIYMSLDGGNTWTYHVGTYPNSGSASITVPNPAATSTSVRFKVKGNGNVFFNVNSSNFTVTYNSSLPVTGVNQVNAIANAVKVFPIPASNILHVNTTTNMQAVVYNTIGQQVWTGNVNGQMEIPVSAWAKGNYFMQLTDNNNQRIIKRFVIE